jgi:integrase/recombinase XerD
MPKVPAVAELIIPEQPTQLATVDAGTSLVGWLIAYCHAEVAGSPRTTLDAKRRDFQLFLGYFARMMRSDSIDDWTRSVTLGFVQWLEGEANEGRGYAPTSVNRTMATLRRAARWIQARRPFLAGDPFERVSDLVVTTPPAKGLSALQRRRILAAADKLVALQAQKNQQPRRKRALLVLLLETGMRISETLRLTLEQYDGKNFRNVKRKGKRRDDVYVSPEARAALSDYFEHERGRGPGALFQSREGKAMLRKDADRYLKQIAAMANANVPEEERVNLHAHLMRHTALKQAEAKFGRAFAQKKSGNVGMQHIERYVQPTNSDYEEAMDKLYS